MASRLRFSAFLASLMLVFSLVAVDHADARRGGSFGSRGARTFQSAPATGTAPSFSPVQRSMTPGSAQSAQPGAAAGGAAQASRGGLFGGMAGGLLGGLALGGLFGMLMGSGFGGAGGFLALIVQMLLIGVGISFLMRFFRNRSGAGAAAAGGTSAGGSRQPYDQGPSAYAGNAASGSRHSGNGFSIPSIGSRANGAPSQGAAAVTQGAGAGPSDEIGITDADLDQFEQKLQEVQAAFSREDYGALRRITTPEVMSYLAEELSENATQGRKNDVTDVKLLQGDLSEAWHEGGTDYASVAMRYSSVDVMRDRTSGEIVEGRDGEASETAELWTFVRGGAEPWKLSAIQEA